MPAPHAAVELALRLRKLRESTWPDRTLSRAELAEALTKSGEPVKAVTIASWENLKSPKVPPIARISAYAQFFATHRTVDAGLCLVPKRDLTPPEMAEFERLRRELLELREGASETAQRRSWQLPDPGPANIVCSQLPADELSPLADPANANYTELLRYADLDALVELHGHIRAENPAMDVFFRASTAVKPDDLTSHLILVGGIAWNEITARLSEMVRLPVRQISDLSLLESGEFFVTEEGGKERRFLPKWRDGDTVLDEDVGLLARVPNPLNSGSTLTICNGIHSRGVYGAVRSLTHDKLREANERYIATHFGSSRSFIILMSVKVIEGETMTPDFNSPGVVLRQWKWPLEEER